MATLTMTDLYKSAFKNLLSTLRDLYVDAEEGTCDYLLLNVTMTGAPGNSSNVISNYYIPVQVRKLWSQHYSQVVLDQVETANRITITTDNAVDMELDGANWIQNCISQFITNRIQLLRSEVMNRKYSHVLHITPDGCISVSMVDTNTYHTGFTLANTSDDPIDVFANWNLVDNRYITMRPVSNTDAGPGSVEDPDDTDEPLIDSTTIRCVTNDDGTNDWICETTPTAEGEDVSDVSCTYDESTGTHTWSC